MDATPQASTNEPGRDGNNSKGKDLGIRDVSHAAAPSHETWPRRRVFHSQLARYKGYLYLCQHYFDTELQRYTMKALLDHPTYKDIVCQ